MRSYATTVALVAVALVAINATATASTPLCSLDGLVSTEIPDEWTQDGQSATFDETINAWGLFGRSQPASRWKNPVFQAQPNNFACNAPRQTGISADVLFQHSWSLRAELKLEDDNPAKTYLAGGVEGNVGNVGVWMHNPAGIEFAFYVSKDSVHLADPATGKASLTRTHAMDTFTAMHVYELRQNGTHAALLVDDVVVMDGISDNEFAVNAQFGPTGKKWAETFMGPMGVHLEVAAFDTTNNKAYASLGFESIKGERVRCNIGKPLTPPDGWSITPSSTLPSFVLTGMQAATNPITFGSHCVCFACAQWHTSCGTTCRFTALHSSSVNSQCAITTYANGMILATDDKNGAVKSSFSVNRCARTIMIEANSATPDFTTLVEDDSRTIVPGQIHAGVVREYEDGSAFFHSVELLSDAPVPSRSAASSGMMRWCSLRMTQFTQ